MALPIQTPRQAIFSDSAAILTEIMKDSTKLLISTAEVIPGLPCAMAAGATPAADRGKLTSIPGTDDIFYGVFVSLPINTTLGRTSLGEMEAKRSNALLNGRLVVRNAVFQASDGSEQTIAPFDVLPTKDNIGSTLDALVVAPGAPANPFAVNIMKWRIAASGGGAGFANIAVLTGVSDDQTEFEIWLPGLVAVYAAAIP